VGSVEEREAELLIGMHAVVVCPRPAGHDHVCLEKGSSWEEVAALVSLCLREFSEKTLGTRSDYHKIDWI
jgi:hypothetical protein